MRPDRERVSTAPMVDSGRLVGSDEPIRVEITQGSQERVAEASVMGAGGDEFGLATTLVGRALLEGSTLRLEANSVARADRLRRLVEERLGGLVAFRIREHADPVARPPTANCCRQCRSAFRPGTAAKG